MVSFRVWLQDMYMNIEPNMIFGIYLLSVMSYVAAITWMGIRRSSQKAVREGQFRRSIHRMERRIQIDPTDAMAVWRKGEMLEAMGRPDQAISYYRTAHWMNPQGYSRWEYMDACQRICRTAGQ
jgi:hypothetical protein